MLFVTCLLYNCHKLYCLMKIKFCIWIWIYNVSPPPGNKKSMYWHLYLFLITTHIPLLDCSVSEFVASNTNKRWCLLAYFCFVCFCTGFFFFLRNDNTHLTTCSMESGAVVVVFEHVVGYTTTYAISAYYHQRCEFECRSGEVYSIQHYVIKVVSGFLRVLRFLPPIKLTAMI